MQHCGNCGSCCGHVLHGLQLAIQVTKFEAARVQTSAQSFSSSHKGCQATVESEPSHTDKLLEENQHLMAQNRKYDGMVVEMQKMLTVGTPHNRKSQQHEACKYTKTACLCSQPGLL